MGFVEALPVAILEAAAGKPVVAARPRGAAEIVKDVVTGRLVPLDDEEALADAICESLGVLSNDREPKTRTAKGFYMAASVSSL